MKYEYYRVAPKDNTDDLVPIFGFNAFSGTERTGCKNRYTYLMFWIFRYQFVFSIHRK